MSQARWVAALVLLAAALGGCQDHKLDHNNTAVLGGTGQADAAHPGATVLTDAQGEPIPAPPAPAGVHWRMARTAGEAALAVWIADTHVMASTWTRGAGWTLPQPLERIYGESSDVQLASNAQGQAMAVWQHRVGNIHSLRFSHYGPDGWSLPDVVPGALPQPDVAGTPPGQGAPQLQMDAQGQVVAQWASGFHANEMQSARYTPGQGWSRAATGAVASAPSASPAPRAPSSAP
jgi:hypothetical protein